MHVKALGMLATLAIGFACVGCANSTPQVVTATPTVSPVVPTINGPGAVLSAVVDCGQDGAARVRVGYGTAVNTTLVSRALAARRTDAVPVFSKNYGGIKAGDQPSDFIITTMPTSGSCRTTLTNYVTGDVIGQRETAGTATLRATVTG